MDRSDSERLKPEGLGQGAACAVVYSLTQQGAEGKGRPVLQVSSWLFSLLAGTWYPSLLSPR